MSKKRKAVWLPGALFLLCVCPYVYLLAVSVFSGSGLTGQYYYEVFLAQTDYLYRFWRSLGLSLLIAAAQVVVSVLAGFGFAKCRFPGRNALFFMLTVLMILPLQVTLVPNYQMLKDMGLLDTYRALILPAIFVPLGTFIMTHSFRAIPNEILGAARVDGCGTLGVICRIAVPMNRSGLACTMLLSFLDGWNMVEQPIAYLKDFEKYPLAVGLASVPPGERGVQIVCCILAVLPPLLLFLCYNRELVEGIAIGGEK